VSHPAIELSSVSKRFGTARGAPSTPGVPSGLLAVNNVSFSVGPGECFGLIGPNGAGKTTTFAMMCGFLQPTAGTLRILDADPTQPGALKGKVGVLPQDSELPKSASVGWLLSYWARLSNLKEPEKEARAALERVGLVETWHKLAGALSHGMAKRVALAQAIMGAPPVVLLDEPTAGLDPKIALHVREIIRDMKGRQTVVVSSHNLQELEELCDGAAILDRGRLVQVGAMADLTSKAEEFRVLVARGDVPLPDVRALAGCQSASLDPSGVLHVLYDGKAVPPEEMISRTVKLLLERGVLILSVNRGRKLEERVMQLT